MQKAVQNQFNKIVSHLYINPLEKCNLRCKICYTRKTDPILTEKEIMNFISKYQKIHQIDVITFCGGEVFTLKYFPHLVNTLTSLHIFVQIITNGTIDKLQDLNNPNSINLIVSLDGLKQYHDANRGEGTFQKSIGFLKKAHISGFHTEIFSIVTKQNYDDLQVFETYLLSYFGYHLNVTYHPRKPPTYLMHHPVSNIVGQTKGFEFLSPDQMIFLMKSKKVFPPKELGCFQIALASDGKIYGCCEGTIPLGKITDPLRDLFRALKERLILWEHSNTLKNCLGCSQPDFMCGIKKYLLFVG